MTVERLVAWLMTVTWDLGCGVDLIWSGEEGVQQFWMRSELYLLQTSEVVSERLVDQWKGSGLRTDLPVDTDSEHASKQVDVNS